MSGFDWEDILGAEGGDIQYAYDDIIPDSWFKEEENDYDNDEDEEY